MSEQNKGEMPAAEAVRLTDLVTYQPGSVVSRTLVKAATGTITLFTFDAGQGLSEHTTPVGANQCEPPEVKRSSCRQTSLTR
jgi:hypothetical protein